MEQKTHEWIELNEFDRRNAVLERARLVFILLISLFDVGFQVATYDDNEGIVLTIAYVWVAIVTFTGALQLVIGIRQLSTELRLGVKVSKTRARQKKKKSVSAVVPSLSSWNDSDGNSSVSSSSLDEYQLNVLNRRLGRAMFMVRSALMREMVVLSVIFYRIMDTDYLFDANFGSCLMLLNSTGPPHHCFTDNMFTRSAYVLYVVFVLTQKLSYVRDYWQTKTRENRLRAQLKKSEEKEGSVLDAFHTTQVHEEEINSIVEIRRLWRSKTSHLKHWINDIAILTVLRRFDGDEVDTLQALRDFNEWLQQFDNVDKVYKKVLVDDFSWTEITHLSKFMSILPIGCNMTCDEKNQVLLIYCCGGSILDADDIIISDGEWEEMVICVLLWLQIVIHHVSERDGIVYKVRLLFDETKTTVHSSIINSISTVYKNIVSKWITIHFDIVLWTTTTPVEPYPKFVHVIHAEEDGIGKLKLKLSPELVPSDLGGLAQFCNDDHPCTTSHDPWGLYTFQYQCLSSLRGRRSIDLDFFQDVDSSQVNDVHAMRKWLFDNHRRAVRRGSRMGWDKYLAKLQKEVDEYVLDGSFEWKTLTLKYTELIQSNGYDPETDAFVTDANLLRFRKRWRQSWGVALRSFVKALCWRSQNGVPQINAQIKRDDMAIDDNKDFAQLLQQIGAQTFLSPENILDGKIYGLAFDDSVVDYSIARSWTEEFLKRALIWLNEYLFIVCDHLSHELHRLVQIISFYRITSVSKTVRVTSKLAKVVRDVNNYYPLTTQLPRILISKSSNQLFDMFQGLGLSDVQKHYLQVSDDRPESQFRLARIVDLKRVPISLGGTQQSATSGKQPKLSKLLQTEEKLT